MTIAIGISGFAKAGKTTVAEYIERRYGVKRLHVAEPLRDMLRVLLRANGVAEDMIERYLTGDLKDGVVIPEIGRTSRELQITLGTEWGRECVHPNLWAKTWSRCASPFFAVMNDSVRFPNEEDVIRGELGGLTILVERFDTHPVSYKWGAVGRWLYNVFGCMWGVHDSERTDRLNPDFILRNNGSLEELFERVDEIIQVEFDIDPVEVVAAA